MDMGRFWILTAVVSVLSVPVLRATAAEAPATQGAADKQAAPAPAKIEYSEETLDNGLRVIYAPLHQAPVVHVRVIYHVGSRDEQPDRRGFAHMFEHMMFRGSAHVKPEEHMKLIGVVGGYANAFTSFDTTQYVDTIPSNQLELALYLEADRMASFKVSEEIFRTERKVVAEEWRIRQNQPYGRVFDDFLNVAFTKHPYRWSPIGDMDDLAAAQPQELQAFFDRYYVPNNAILLIAGDIDVAATKKLVRQYFAWIPDGKKVERNIPAEPQHNQAVRSEVSYAAPLPVVVIAYRTGGYGQNDDYALSLLATIVGQGESSRLYKALVSSENPLCMGVQAGYEAMEDYGGVGAGGMVMAGKSADEVEKVIVATLEEVAAGGVTQEELDKARTQHRVSLIESRETAENLASQLGEEAVMTGDAGRVNTALARLDAVTRQDIQAAAKKYIQPDNSVAFQVKPDRLAMLKSMVTKEAKIPDAITAPATGPASQKAVDARTVKFPDGYAKAPPIADAQIAAKFAKGQAGTINGVQVIVMEDHRLPLVSWNLTMRSGSFSEPAGKEGLGDLTASLIQRGQADLDYQHLSEDLESRGISLSVKDGGDYTRLNGSATSDQLDHAVLRSRQMLLEPSFPQDEMAKLKMQTVNSLKVAREQPRTVAEQDLKAALYGDSVFGRYATPQSVSGIGLDDVKRYYKNVFQPDGAYLIISGDVTISRGRDLAKRLLSGWTYSGAAPKVDYTVPEPARKRRILVVDRPEGEQATIYMGVRSYTNRNPQKYAGSVASKILTSGIDSRLGKYVRAEKGLAYGVWGVFSPDRNKGEFEGGTDTSLETAGAAVEAMFKVFEDMRREPVSDVELTEAKTRVAGGMVMGIQTIGQQAEYRGAVILNDYPVDYYDAYPAKIAAVTAEQVQDVMKEYARDDRMQIVVVAPAQKVKAQLEELGEVVVVPMPAAREGQGLAPASQPATQQAAPASAPATPLEKAA